MDPRGVIDRARGVARRVVRGRPLAKYPAPGAELASMLTGVRWEGDSLVLTGWVYAPGSPAGADGAVPRLRVEDARGVLVVEAEVTRHVDPAVNEASDDARHDHSGAAFEARLDLRGLRRRAARRRAARRRGPWTVVCTVETGTGPVSTPFAARDAHGSAGFLLPTPSTDVRGAPIRPEWSETNGLVLRRGRGSQGWAAPGDPRVLAEHAELDAEAGVLLVRGHAMGGPSDRISFELRGPRQTVGPDDVRWEGDAFTARLPLVVPDWYGVPRPLVSGTYRLLAGEVGEVGEVGEEPVEVLLAPSAAPALGRTERGTDLHARVERTRSDGVRLRIDPPLRDDERGAFAQMQLRRAYHAMQPVAPSERPIAYYECYYGVSATDSARAIQEELVARAAPVRHVWGVADHSVPVPPGTEAVLRHSREWWQVLGSASYLTFNAGLPAGLVRRPGQVVVQTWHGTPLKLLGHDRPVNHGKDGFEESTSRYVSRWDHLLAGNPHSAEAFRSAWFYEGPVHQLGYPRNDDLARPDPARLARVRQRLGVREDQTVVLYAPTWREGSRVMPELLDLDRLAGLLGPEHVFLVRGHMNITRWRHRPQGRSVLDVTSYPEINDLFLVADVAVTDYSSIMFDFSVTGKPMLFFVPDLEDYRDRRRGVYFDLAASAPGPLLTTTDEVADAVRGLGSSPGSSPGSYAGSYAAWQARFNPRDDGRAAARVVEEIYRFG